MKNRFAAATIAKKTDHPHGRIIVVTGARQTGKTTLVRHVATEYTYVSIEDPVARDQYAGMTSEQWHRRFPCAILDEIQKKPVLVESIKACYDQFEDVRYILLGSSQLLLLEKVRESLAGRVSLIELLPLTIPELTTNSWETPIGESAFIRWIRNGCSSTDIFEDLLFDSGNYAVASDAVDHYLKFGGMPEVSKERLSDTDRFLWLENYIRTYLERDIRDLADFRDLEPFTKAQKSLALQTGNTVTMSSLAQAADISSKTAKRFLRYLELSYQVVQLQPWFRNQKKRLVKAPKIHFLDPGIQRTILQRRGELTGSEYESAIVSEIIKQLRYAGLPCEISHLRTHDGREVDLLIELEEGFIPVEIKMSENISERDTRHLRKLREILDKPILHSFIISRSKSVKHLATNITSVPDILFLA